MKAFAHDVFTYPLPPGHRFPLGKYRLVRQGAEASPAIQVAEARAATEDELALAHDRGYLERVSGTGLTRREELALGLPWSPELVERARRSVGATLLATDASLADGIGANLGGGTHHAFAGSAHGFPSSGKCSRTFRSDLLRHSPRRHRARSFREDAQHLPG